MDDVLHNLRNSTDEANRLVNVLRQENEALRERGKQQHKYWATKYAKLKEETDDERKRYQKHLHNLLVLINHTTISVEEIEEALR